MHLSPRRGEAGRIRDGTTGDGSVHAIEPSRRLSRGRDALDLLDAVELHRNVLTPASAMAAHNHGLGEVFTLNQRLSAIRHHRNANPLAHHQA